MTRLVLLAVTLRNRLTLPSSLCTTDAVLSLLLVARILLGLPACLGLLVVVHFLRLLL